MYHGANNPSSSQQPLTVPYGTGRAGTSHLPWSLAIPRARGLAPQPGTAPHHRGGHSGWGAGSAVPQCARSPQRPTSPARGEAGQREAQGSPLHHACLLSFSSETLSCPPLKTPIQAQGSRKLIYCCLAETALV